jgi:ABC-type nitrate/sulfonate/bicarbonate transport system substrate-binding protein
MAWRDRFPENWLADGAGALARGAGTPHLAQRNRSQQASRCGRPARQALSALAAMAAAVAVLVAGCSPAQPSAGGASKPGAPASGTGANAPAGAGTSGAPGGAPSGSAPAAAPTKLRVATVALSGASIPAWVTQDSGRFAANGLDVDLTVIDASTTAVQAMIAGELQVLHVALGAVMDASLAGADLVMLASTAPALVFSLYSGPEIRQVSDLRGKILGANRPGTTTYFAASYLLKDNGMELGNDVTLLPTGSVTNTLAALQAGQVAAGIISPPSTIKANGAGYHEVVDLSYIEYHTNGVVVRRDSLQRERDVAKRYLTALVEGIARARQDKRFTKQVIGKYTQTSEDDVLEETYERYVPKLLKPIPYVTPGGVQVGLEEFSAGNPQAASARPEQFYDNSLLQEIEQSGLLDRLYAGQPR